MEGWEPYAMLFIVKGERGPDGAPYYSVSTGVDAYDNPHVRDAVEEQARTAFAHLHPGAVISSTSWGPLYDLGGDDE